MRYLTVILLSWGLSSCCWLGNCEDPPEPVEETLPSFSQVPRISPLNTQHLHEVSGMAPSYRFSNHLWLMEDGGNEAGIELMKDDGTYVRKVRFAGVNRDWEDLAIGPGPEQGKNYLYIGEIGDNNARYGDYYVYRFEEPASGQEQIDTYDTLHFRYPNNESYDAETLVVDPLTRDIYIITKNQLNVRVYRLPYPQHTAEMNVAEFMGTIRYLLIVSGDVSADGHEVLLKAYNAVYYWKRKAGETLFQTLSRSHDVSAPYILEPQGEAICWSIPAAGYYTLSEKGNEPGPPPLYYYAKEQ